MNGWLTPPLAHLPGSGESVNGRMLSLNLVPRDSRTDLPGQRPHTPDGLAVRQHPG